MVFNERINDDDDDDDTNERGLLVWIWGRVYRKVGTSATDRYRLIDMNTRQLSWVRIPIALDQL